MLRGGDVKEIRDFHREGLSISRIQALTGYARSTIRKYLAHPETPRFHSPRKGHSKLDPFVPYVRERTQAGVWNGVVLLRELRDRGYSGGYTILTDYLRPLRETAFEAAVRRFETPPGHQAQVDWGEVGVVETGQERKKLSGFVLTLGYSRAIFADLATDQRLGTLMKMHETAFEELGGVPREILYDWMKTVALGTDDRGETRWNPQFADFARYWGFVPRLCRPYRPQAKGKTERGVGYLKGNFIVGREACGLDDLRSQLHGWMWEVANRRVHGTTHRRVDEAWREEVPSLRSVEGQPAYPYEPSVERKVARDAFVSYATNRYPVPWTLAGQRVILVERGEEVVVLVGSEPVIRHPLCRDRHRVIDPGALHADLPLGAASGGRRKPSVTIRETLPEVEARPLAVYEALAWDRNDECPAVATEGAGNTGVVARAIGEIGTNGGSE
jgi:transposase